MNDKRLRGWGITVGEMAPGPLNKITDVPGVTVGHTTLDDEFHKTGVTVVIPAPGNLFTDKMTAASFVINGFGKTCGTVQIDELGTLETPIALTGTLDVGRIADALVTYPIRQCEAEGVECLPVNPGIVKVPSKMKGEYGQAMLANSITLTPGTITMDVAEDEQGQAWYYIHWIDVAEGTAEEQGDAIKGTLEKWVGRIFE